MKLSGDCRLMLNKQKINTRPDGVKLDPYKGGDMSWRKTAKEPIFRKKAGRGRKVDETGPSRRGRLSHPRIHQPTALELRP